MSVRAAAGRRVAFVIPHPYIDALPCFREPIARLARDGWSVDVYTRLSPNHPAPWFDAENVRLIPCEVTRSGAVALVGRLALRRPRYDWIFAVPQWSLHYAAKAAALARIPLACLSDELTAQAEAATQEQKRWKERERRAHQRCAFTIALSEERAAFIREENRLGDGHPIYVVPNAAPGPARRLESHYYQDTLAIPRDARVVLHAGSWWWKRTFGDLERVPQRWSASTVLVFQGRLSNHLGPVATGDSLRVSSTILPGGLVDYAVSSAHIGLAVYDTATANNRRMGTASGKVLRYLKNALPVIVTRHPSFDWIESEGCGVCIDRLDDIEQAVERIWRRYGAYVSAVTHFYDAHLDFERTFEPVVARLNGT